MEKYISGKIEYKKIFGGLLNLPKFDVLAFRPESIVGISIPAIRRWSRLDNVTYEKSCNIRKLYAHLIDNEIEEFSLWKQKVTAIYENFREIHESIEIYVEEHPNIVPLLYCRVNGELFEYGEDLYTENWKKYEWTNIYLDVFRIIL